MKSNTTTETKLSKKQMMVEALHRFINQRSGIDYRNYAGGDWKQSREAFNGDYRPMLKHGRQARALLRAVELRDSITAEMIQAATRAYCGRLQLVERNGSGVAVDYTTGQYFPTEYRSAACAVLATVLWDYWQPDYKTREEIQRQARREFGRGIASEWFN
jgi:hypothetical protein